MNIREIVIVHLKCIGADGLCAAQCGCGLDDFMPCAGDRDISECKPAIRHVCDGQCGDCMGSASEIKSGLNACYRPMDTNEPEDTHL